MPMGAKSWRSRALRARTAQSENAPTANGLALDGALIGIGSAAELFSQPGGCALKLYRPHVSQKVLDGERGALELARQAGLPVPEPYSVVEQDGRLGLVMERIEGPVLLRRLTRRPWEGLSLVRRMASLHARLHNVSAAALPDQAERYLPRLERAGLADGLAVQLRARLLQSGQATRLCHGDFHLSNLILSGRRLVLIDWDKAHAGVPALDVARTLTLLIYGMRGEGNGGIAEMWLRHRLANAYRRHYAAQAGAEANAAVDWWLPVALASKLGYVSESIHPTMHAHIACLMPLNR